MRLKIFCVILAITMLMLAGSSAAFDGQRKGKVLAMGFGYVAAGPHTINTERTTYRPGVAIRLVAGYATSNRSMYTFGIARQAIFYTDARGTSMEGTNWMLELSMTRYLRETHHAAFWRTGLGLIDWGIRGNRADSPREESTDLDFCLVGGVGYMFLKGLQVQLDLVAGPAPSGGDGKIKGLLRLELVGMIY